jgi:hypothetical protein
MSKEKPKHTKNKCQKTDKKTNVYIKTLKTRKNGDFKSKNKRKKNKNKRKKTEEKRQKH